MQENNICHAECGSIMLEFKLLPDSDNANLFSVKRIENNLTTDSYDVLIDSGVSIPVWADGLAR